MLSVQESERDIDLVFHQSQTICAVVIIGVDAFQLRVLVEQELFGLMGAVDGAIVP